MKDLFDFVHKIHRGPAIAVQFIDKGKDRQFSSVADPKEFFRLWFHALGRINQHDRGIGSNQGSISIFTEILMARCIKDINAVPIIIKLEHAACNRNPSLFFNFHPVRNGVTICFAALDRSGKMDGAPIKKQFFGQGRFTRSGWEMMAKVRLLLILSCNSLIDETPPKARLRSIPYAMFIP